MTSKKSSADRFGFTFLKGLRSLLPIAIAAGIAVFYLHCGVFGQIVSNSIETPRRAEALKAETVFLFNGSMNEVLYPAVTVTFGFVCAFLLFSYLHRKSSINVCFSLSISKARFFAAKYLAGAAAIFCVAFIPLTACTIANLAYFGFYGATVKAGLFLALKAFSASFYTYTVSALVMTLIGSFTETFVYSVAAIVSPLLADYAVSRIIGLIYGSPFTPSPVKHFGGAYIQGRDSLFGFSAMLFPAGTSDFSNCTSLYKYENAAEFTPPSFAPTLIFILIIALIAAAAVFSAGRYKAEKAEFLGTSPLAQGFCVVVTGLFLGATVYSVYAGVMYAGVYSGDRYNLLIPGAVLFILATAVIMIVGYTVVDLLFVRSFKKYKKRLKYLGRELLIALLVIAVAASCAALAMRLPAKAEIKSAGITLFGNSYDVPGRDYYPQNMSGYLTGADGVLRLDTLLMTPEDTLFVYDGFTAKEDIELIKEIDSSLKALKGKEVNIYHGDETPDAPVPCRIRIEYTLENGRVKAREYTAASNSIISKLEALALSENTRKKAAGTLKRFCEYEVFEQYADGEAQSVHVALMSPDFTNTVFPHGLNDPKVRRSLIDAMADDITAGTLPLNFISDSELLGYIWLNTDSGFTCSDTAADTPADIPYIDTAGRNNEDYEVRLADGNLFPVFADMKNTLACLEKNGLTSYFESSENIVRVYTFKYNKSDSILRRDTDSFVLNGVYMGKNNLEYTEFSPPDEFYIADRVSPVTDTRDRDVFELLDELLPGEKTVYENERAAKAAKNFRGVYLSCYEGSYAVMVSESGRIICGYIPEAE